MKSMKLSREDLATPANAATAIGLLMTLAGALRLNTVHGIALVGIGRALDLVDGPLARKFGSSRFGAALDGTADKIATFAIIAAAFYFQSVPFWVLVYVLLQNIINMAIVAYAEYRKRNPESSLLGKRGMFFQNSALVLFTVSSVLEASSTQSITRNIAIAALTVAVPLSLLGSIGYLRHALGKSTT